MLVPFRVSARSMCVIPCLAVFYSLTPASSWAQSPRTVPPIPPPGIQVSDADHKELTEGAETLKRAIAALQTDLPKTHPDLVRFLPDVQIYHKAVQTALTYNEFFNNREIQTARDLLAQGIARADALKVGTAPWTTQTGLVALGYISKIDGSVQPYGLLVPPEWTPGETTKRRMDFFCHGRGETLSEVAFIDQRQKSAGEFTPPGAFVLQPYGRFCCANRFAGEVDLFEALANAKTRYAIDDDRLVMRGFSMGGASAWQYATHHSDTWAAAAPGAGFSETIGFLRLRRAGQTSAPRMGKIAAALVRLHRLRREFKRVPNGRLQWRHGRAKAGRRQDGGSPQKRGIAPDARHWAEHGAQIRIVQQARYQCVCRRRRAKRPRADARPSALHDMDASLQHDGLCDRDRFGQALGTRPCERRFVARRSCYNNRKRDPLFGCAPRNLAKP